MLQQHSVVGPTGSMSLPFHRGVVSSSLGMEARACLASCTTGGVFHPERSCSRPLVCLRAVPRRFYSRQGGSRAPRGKDSFGCAWEARSRREMEDWERWVLLNFLPIESRSILFSRPCVRSGPILVTLAREACRDSPVACSLSFCWRTIGGTSQLEAKSCSRASLSRCTRSLPRGAASGEYGRGSTRLRRCPSGPSWGRSMPPCGSTSAGSL